ncbi:hypothetical protein CMUS01_06958 [Colletotrichum musicola]|uniref:Uncharacterized protein n=1 Tax=Colletotrichum musicola TaxID=2175873 RepID=A0A8H6KIS4_9PEZI|nr:hypothetical protein CMUS01_06958 [Colletotrichum musicola]
MLLVRCCQEGPLQSPSAPSRGGLVAPPPTNTATVAKHPLSAAVIATWRHPSTGCTSEDGPAGVEPAVPPRSTDVRRERAGRRHQGRSRPGRPIMGVRMAGGLDDVDQLIGGGNGGCARTPLRPNGQPSCQMQYRRQAALGETTRSGTYIIPRPGVPCFLFPPFCRSSFHSSYAVSIVELLQRSIEAASRVVVVTLAGT